MHLSTRRLSLLIKRPASYILLLLALGCTAAPNPELAGAQRALARAYHEGAPEYANTEYLAAQAALRQAESLLQQGRRQAANELLPIATAQAEQAAITAAATKQQLEEQARRQAAAERLRRQQPKERQRQQSQAQRPPKPEPKPVVKLSNYNVTTEENLWDIAARAEVYDDPLLWPLLYKANRDQIKDPRQVFPGQTLTIPRETSAEAIEAARQEADSSDIFPRNSKP